MFRKRLSVLVLAWGTMTAAQSTEERSDRLRDAIADGQTRRAISYLDEGVSLESAIIRAGGALDLNRYSVCQDTLLAEAIYWYTPPRPAAMRKRRTEQAAWLDVIKAILRAGADPNTVGWEDSPLTTAATDNHVNIIDLLIQAGAHVNARNRHHDTALHVAVQHGHIDATRALIRAGADMNAKNVRGITALHLAVRHNHIDAALALIQAGAEVEQRNFEEQRLFEQCIRNKNYMLAAEFFKVGLPVGSWSNNCTEEELKELGKFRDVITERADLVRCYLNQQAQHTPGYTELPKVLSGLIESYAGVLIAREAAELQRECLPAQGRLQRFKERARAFFGRR